MTPFLADKDFTLYVGDVRDVLAGLPDSSVDCVVTSPPYWGLRDYGTGSWEGGDPDCDHTMPSRVDEAKAVATSTLVGSKDSQGHLKEPSYRDVCGKCGARRQDQQLGLEPTPDLYVANMVAVFREVRRVLADHGTCWVNLGDSYASQGDRKHGGWNGDSYYTHGPQRTKGEAMGAPMDLDASGLKVKDLCGIPWRVAFALQNDGWYLRADIIWSKPNPMPESVTDRPTKAHEYVFLLTKRPRYFFDQEAVRQPAKDPEDDLRRVKQAQERRQARGDSNTLDVWTASQPYAPNGRNIRSVWEIATQPYPEAHFATYPEELVRRCLLAGCPEWVCGTCGKPRERIVGDVAVSPDLTQRTTSHYDTADRYGAGNGGNNGLDKLAAKMRAGIGRGSLGWSDCGHDSYRPGVVLDPFIGSGTTAVVARKHGRKCVGIELNPAYSELIAKRTRQLSLLAEELTA